MLPLFNDVIPVSEDDVQLWLDKVPNLSGSLSRREAYRRAYNVDDKIRAAKLAGRWPPEGKTSKAS